MDIEKLKTWHTRKLLAYLNNCRPNDYYCYDEDYIRVEQIKSVLATREHIMNKQEAKEHRRKMAKQNKGCNKGKNK